MIKTIIEQISFWGAVLGATILALNIAVSGWAYVLLLLSNIASIYLLKGTGAPSVISYQMFVFFVINIIGISQWLM